MRRVGESFEVVSDVRLGPLVPEDVAVEIYHGPLDAQHQVVQGRGVAMTLESSPGPGLHRYAGAIPCERSGMHGYTVRVRPSHPEANNMLCTGLMTWLEVVPALR
jgi:starch phosphorylase